MRLWGDYPWVQPQMLHRAGEDNTVCQWGTGLGPAAPPGSTATESSSVWLQHAQALKKLQHKFVSLLLPATRTIRKGFPSRWEITDGKETRLQPWFCLHHVLCPRESQQCCRWFPEGQMLMEILNNICSSGRSIVVAKQEILVALEKFPYLPNGISVYPTDLVSLIGTGFQSSTPFQSAAQH